jgi:hypothetical protein
MDNDINEKNNVLEETDNNHKKGILYSTYKSDQLIEKIQEFKNLLQMDLKSLSSLIEKLDQASLLLTLIPKEVEHEINRISPKLSKDITHTISTDLIKKFTYDFNISIQSCTDSIDALRDKVLDITEEIVSLKEQSFKRKILNLALLLGFALITSIGATYYSLTWFPQTVRIDHSGNINIEQSRVFVEGKNTFNTSKDTKIIKK